MAITTIASMSVNTAQLPARRIPPTASPRHCADARPSALECPAKLACSVYKESRGRQNWREGSRAREPDDFPFAQRLLAQSHQFRQVLAGLGEFLCFPLPGSPQGCQAGLDLLCSNLVIAHQLAEFRTPLLNLGCSLLAPTDPGRGVYQIINGLEAGLDHRSLLIRDSQLLLEVLKLADRGSPFRKADRAELWTADLSGRCGSDRRSRGQEGRFEFRCDSPEFPTVRSFAAQRSMIE